MPESLFSECPRCGEPMLTGYVDSVRQLFWSEKPLREPGLSSQSEQITKIPWTHAINLPGYRCEPCKMLILDYSSAEP